MLQIEVIKTTVKYLEFHFDHHPTSFVWLLVVVMFAWDIARREELPQKQVKDSTFPQLSCQDLVHEVHVMMSHTQFEKGNANMLDCTQLLGIAVVVLYNEVYRKAVQLQSINQAHMEDYNAGDYQ